MSQLSISSSAVEDSGKIGMKGFLETLPEHDIYGLLKTTTGGLIAADNIKEAIDIICRYSDEVTLLNRQRVKKEYLINYLHKKKSSFNFKNETTKTRLCSLVLKLWGNKSDHDSYKFRDKDSNNVLKIKSENSSSSPSASNYSFKREDGDGDNNYSVGVGSQSSNTSLSLSQDDDDMDLDYMSQRKAEFLTGQQLAIEFSKWFYSMLNLLSEDFGPNHFWSNCNMNFEIIKNTETTHIQQISGNGEECYKLFKSLIVNHNLKFNPNLDFGLGVRGQINPHGLAQVLVCGTIHSGNTVQGIFEQVFGLMKDLNSGNNYKIQYALLRLRERNYLAHFGTNQCPPAISDTSLAGIIEEVDDD